MSQQKNDRNLSAKKQAPIHAKVSSNKQNTKELGLHQFIVSVHLFP